MHTIVGANFLFGGGVEMNHQTPRSNHDDSVPDHLQHCNKVRTAVGEGRELVLRAHGLLKVHDEGANKLHTFGRVDAWSVAVPPR